MKSCISDEIASPNLDLLRELAALIRQALGNGVDPTCVVMSAFAAAADAAIFVAKEEVQSIYADQLTEFSRAAKVLVEQMRDSSASCSQRAASLARFAASVRKVSARANSVAERAARHAASGSVVAARAGDCVGLIALAAAAADDAEVAALRIDNPLLH